MRAASSFPGVDRVSVNMKDDMKLTVVGDMDPVTLAKKLRKVYNTDIIPTGEQEEAEEDEVFESGLKVVIKVDVNDERGKKYAMRAVSNVKGLDSIPMDLKNKKLTVIGDVDPVYVVTKLRKFYHAELLSVRAVKKRTEKKDEPKKTEEKVVPEYVKAYIAFNPHTRLIKFAREGGRGGA